ncbi:TPA: hypothetical protein ACSKHE_002653 [Listeria innocua]|uniref:hypothetical protein n=1 Tax=Listeria TaxID=1637 RepID=UPI001E3062EC|nr:hypothetical protein [Listeria innocua]UPH69581.1 hypothetical protein EWI68_06485 [Listeria innocua]
MKKLNYFSIGFDYDEEKNPIMSFDSQSHCISEMYSGAFKPMVTKETSCIDINCIPAGKKWINLITSMPFIEFILKISCLI